jgi:L-asparagine transporter-like permease
LEHAVPGHATIAREQVLARELGAGEQAMLAIGNAIGTGLFLGSGVAVSTAGPGVVLSYLLIAVVALLIGSALAEMCVAHPTAGSFGVHAEMYLTPFAGYAVRVSYWLMQLVATGGHMVAVSIYMKYWFPQAPGAVWIVGFSLLLVYLNARSVGSFGRVEYWFVMAKVAALVVFVTLGLALVAGITGHPLGLANLAAGPALPRGFTGVWLACCFVLYSFIGVEAVAVASGEAREPERTIPRAMRRTVLGLSGLYVAAVIVLVLVMPWSEAGLGESPFVSVLRRTGVRGAAALMNFVVLTAALSAANANLYTVARTLFSLARGGYAPAALGDVDRHGIPVKALVTSAAGLGVAVVIQALWPDSAYVWFFGVALFGAIVVWFTAFLTHVAFRRHWQRTGTPLLYRSPYGAAGSWLGATLMLALLVTTWWAPGLRGTLLAAGPWLLVLTVGYRVSREMAPRAVGLGATAGGGPVPVRR